MSSSRRRLGALQLVALVLGVSCVGFGRSSPAGATGPSAAVKEARAASPDRAEGDKSPPWVLFRFHAGAPLPGPPAVADDGTIYVASAEGYVHALDPDGSFRWSYTVDGAIVGGPAVDPSGHVFVATTSRRVYALTSSGRRYWLFNSPVRPDSGVVRGTDGTLYFVGSDRHLWAISSRAGAKFRVALSGAVTAGPVAGPAEQVAVASSEGDVSVVQTAARRWNVSLGAPAEQLFWLAGGLLGAVTDDSRLLALQPPSKAVAWQVGGVARAAAARGERVVAALEGGALLTLSARDGHELSRLPAAAKLSAPPAVSAAGTIFAPGQDGTLRAFPPEGGVLSVRVASGALHEPIVTRGRIVAAGGDGSVAVIDEKSWRRGGF